MNRTLVALIVLCFAGGASAEPGAAAIFAALDADAGWEVHKLDAKGGVDVYKKTIEGVGISAFKGEKIVDVDPDTLFAAIIDFSKHAGLSEDIPLTHSEVLSTKGNTVDFYQYLDVPGWTLANDRYWFARAVIMRDVGGQKGHHKQTWQGIDAGLYPEALKRAQAVDEDAVLTPLNYGSWEVVPEGPGKTRLIYRVISDPGGRLPKSAQSLATGKTLPDNLLQFEAEAKRRAGR